MLMQLSEGFLLVNAESSSLFALDKTVQSIGYHHLDVQRLILL